MICGVSFIPHEDQKLPDCEVFKCLRKGNFLKCSTLFSVQEITNHIRKHKRNGSLRGFQGSVKGISDV